MEPVKRIVENSPSTSDNVASTSDNTVGGHKTLESIPGTRSEREKFYNSAEEHRQAGDYKEAINDYCRVLALAGGNHAGALMGRGDAKRMLNGCEDALQDLHEALKIEPNSVQALETRGQVYQAMGKYEEASADFAQVQKGKGKEIDKKDSTSGTSSFEKEETSSSLGEWAENHLLELGYRLNDETWLTSDNCLKLMKSSKFIEFLNSIEGLKLLGETKNGLELIKSDRFIEFLNSYNGTKFLESSHGLYLLSCTENGLELMKNDRFADFVLKSKEGLRFFNNPRTQSLFMFYDSGVEFMKSDKFIEFLKGQEGLKFFKRYTKFMVRRQSLLGKAVKFTFETIYGEKANDRSLEFLDSPNGLEFLKSDNGLWFLNSYQGKIWLKSDAGKKYKNIMKID